MDSSLIELYLLLQSSPAVDNVGRSEDPSTSHASSPPPLKNILEGRYIDALQEPSVQLLLAAHDHPSITSPLDYYRWVQDKVHYILQDAAIKQNEQSKERECLNVLLQAAVACIYTFVQHNLTGPLQPSSSPDPSPALPTPSPLHLFARHLSLPSSSQEGSLGDEKTHPHERWAANALQLDGEETIGRCAHVQYLLLAQILLLAPLLNEPARPAEESESSNTGHMSSFRKIDLLPTLTITSLSSTQDPSCLPPSASTSSIMPLLDPRASELISNCLPSWYWWALRCTTLHQHLLNGQSPTLLARSSLFIKILVSWADVPPSPKQPSTLTLENRPSLRAALFIELAQVHHLHGSLIKAASFLEKAGEVMGLRVELTGALGMRTVHQVDAKAQLVVRAKRNRLLLHAPSEDQGAWGDIGKSQLNVDLGQQSDDLDSKSELGGESGSGEAQRPGRETNGLKLEEDVFIAPMLIGEEGERLESKYSGLEQALLLGWCTQVKKGTSRDELRSWQMAPYVEAVLSQDKSQFMLRAAAQLLKVRHERTRNRTKERSLMTAEQLAEAISLASSASFSSVTSSSSMRLRCAFHVWFPLQVLLKKEIAEHYISMGFIGAALKSLEELELWESLITCYRLLNKKNMAEEIIQKRLKVTPDDPKLWNSLGDLHMEDRYYHEAWKVSKGRNARSQRSLGRSAIRRKDWAAAGHHLENAVKLNPLHTETWFNLGYAHVKNECHERALLAFSRVTQHEPDHGEAWNNLAAIWMQLGKNQEAFSALSECVKHKRESWQVWENYASIAVQGGSYAAAARGLSMVLDLTQGQKLRMETIRGLVEALERGECGVLNPNASRGVSKQDELQQDEEEMDDFVLLSGQEPLLSSQPLPDQGDVDKGLDQDAKRTEDAAAQERARQQLLLSVGAVLKHAVTNSCCTPECWGLLGRWYGLQGAVDARKEALLKQVRGLTTTPFKSDMMHFEQMARASIDLCRAYLDSAKCSMEGSNGAGPIMGGGMRDLSAARMHLKGVVKQCEAFFEDHELLSQMKVLLGQVEQEEKMCVKVP